MSGCGSQCGANLTRQKSILIAVLAINAVMFVAELTFGFISRSEALVADSLDMLGDAAVYGMSLFVLGAGHQIQAKVARLKGVLMLLFGVLVLGDAVRRSLGYHQPVSSIMMIVATAALVANLACFVMLYKSRSDNVNMRSAFICSSNDVLINLGVILAAVLVYFLGSGLPDLIVGVGVAGLVIYSSFQVIRTSNQQAG